MKRTTLLLAAGLLISGGSLQAELTPALNKGAAQVAEVDFASGELAKPWAAAKGAWVVKEGVLLGSELPADEHAAVLTLVKPHVDSAVRFRFKLDGTKAFHLSYNHPKGHLFRVRFDTKGAVLSMDKDKKDPASKPETLAKVSEPLEMGKWHTLLCETKGQKVRVELDNGLVLEGEHANLSKPKTGYRLIVQGKGLSLDDVVVWSAD